MDRRPRRRPRVQEAHGAVRDVDTPMRPAIVRPGRSSRVASWPVDTPPGCIVNEVPSSELHRKAHTRGWIPTPVTSRPGGDHGVRAIPCVNRVVAEGRGQTPVSSRHGRTEHDPVPLPRAQSFPHDVHRDAFEDTCVPRGCLRRPCPVYNVH